MLTRRDFVSAAALGTIGVTAGATAAAAATITAQQQQRAAKLPIIVSAANGFPYIDRGYQQLSAGADTLEAAISVVRGPEDDPNDDSVGLGGLPNEEGVVELDASCMHGPTRRAGAVGGVRNIRSVAQLAREVMLHTGHVMLVGEGAERFAVARGFKREDLLTEESRKVWLLWKESHADWWGPGLADPKWQDRLRGRVAIRGSRPALPAAPGHGRGAGHRARSSHRRGTQGAVSADRYHSLLSTQCTR